MNKPNRNLGKILIIFGIGLIAILWITAFNAAIYKQTSSKKLINENSYFGSYEMDLFPSGSFSNLSTKDYKVVVYNGWAPWCSACVSEMTALEELSKEYKDKGILVVGVVADYYEMKIKYPDEDYDAEIKDTIDAYGITYPIVLSNERFAEIVKPSMEDSFPTTWVVDSNGNLIEYFIGKRTESEWRKLFDEWLKATNEE